MNCSLHFVSSETFFPKFFLLKTVLFHFSMFEYSIFNNKNPRTKHSHLQNGSQLISRTVHFYSPSHFCFVWWKLYFPFNILAKLCFFNFFTLEFNVFNNKIPETKYWHLSNGSQLMVHFFSLAHFIFVWWKSYFHLEILMKLCSFNLFSI